MAVVLTGTGRNEAPDPVRKRFEADLLVRFAPKYVALRPRRSLSKSTVDTVSSPVALPGARGGQPRANYRALVDRELRHADDAAVPVCAHDAGLGMTGRGQ